MKIKNKHLNLRQIAESGQAFRWYANKDGYVLVANHECVQLSQEDDIVIIDSDNRQWLDYFDITRDYEEIINYYANKDSYLKEATSFGSGIRILKQDPFEMIVTYIISANNNIKRITDSVKQLANRYGSFIRNIDGVDYYDFPSIDQLKEVTIDEFRQCGVGYRDKYLFNLVHSVTLEEINKWKTLTDQALKQRLLEIKGVGEKVANCILLFGYDRVDGFPIDTWIKKIIIKAYEISEKELKSFALEYFKPYGGIAQQYLFYYGRQK